MFDKTPPEVQAMALSVVLAALRIIYEGKEDKPARILIESLLCGFLTLTAAHAVSAMGLNLNWMLVCGGCIGYFGTKTIKILAVKFINKKIEK